jgi:4'-phosphopantetheinyl transferase
VQVVYLEEPIIIRMVTIHYAYISEKKHADLLKEYLPRFSSKFQEKIQRYRRWQDAQLSLLGRIMLLQTVEIQKGRTYCDHTVKLTEFNKPYFEDHFLHFNVSHSGDIVVFAHSEEQELGVDIELMADIEVADFKEQMTANEWNYILQSPDRKAAFFSYWAKKEAVIKAYGSGLNIPLNSFEVLHNKALLNEHLFYVKEITIDERYKCFVSLNKNEEAIEKKLIQF